jgi:lipid II:glycine glycyltransferase (peptidoglycan interpeptide bridge formation enzyme)
MNGALVNMTSTIKKNHTQNKEELQTVQRETNDMMQCIIKNQECMMEMLTKSNINNTKKDVVQTSPPRNPNTWYRVGNYSPGEPKDNNFLQLINATINRKTPERIATPDGDKLGYCNEDMQVAEQQ